MRFQYQILRLDGNGEPCNLTPPEYGTAVEADNAYARAGGIGQAIIVRWFEGQRDPAYFLYGSVSTPFLDHAIGSARELQRRAAA